MTAWHADIRLDPAHTFPHVAACIGSGSGSCIDYLDCTRSAAFASLSCHAGCISCFWTETNADGLDFVRRYPLTGSSFASVASSMQVARRFKDESIMRLSTIVLLVLAISVVNFSGCKVRGKNGAVAKRTVSQRLLRRAPSNRSAEAIGRSLSTRGTAQCDCFTCRSKRQQVQEEYTIESAHTPLEYEIEPQTISVEQPNSTIIGATIEQSQVLISDPAPAIQEVHGQLIEDSELTNELPTEPTVPAVPEPAKPELPSKLEIDGQLQLISPKTGVNTQQQPQPTPVVQSSRIKAEPISAKLREVPSETEQGAQPVVNESVFQLKTRDNSVLEINKPKPQRRKSIWFTPTVNSEPVPVIERFEPTPAAEPQPSQPEEPGIFSAPIIEDEIKDPQPSESIVLKARPVDHHTIYNSRRPTHAPVRQARLTSDSHFVKPPRQPRNTQLNFYPLPPQQPSQVSPVPAAPVPAAPITAVPAASAPVAPVLEAPRPVVNPQANSQALQPVPQQADDSAELRLKATAGPTGNQRPRLLAAPTARVIPANNPILKLNASPTANQTLQLPAIAKIQGQSQDRVVVGSLQTPQGSTSQETVAGPNRLHTSPWQPMQTGQNGSKQVQQSIRQLMIQPQQEANFATDGIHR